MFNSGGTLRIIFIYFFVTQMCTKNEYVCKVLGKYVDGFLIYELRVQLT